MTYLRNTRILFLMNLFLTMSLYAPIEVIYLKSVNLPLAVISLLNLFVPISMAVLEVPTGIIGDYVGRKQVLILCALSHAASTFILLFATDTFQFFIAYFFEGLAWSFYSGNTDAIVVEDATYQKADISRQLAFFYSGMSLGPVISGLFNTSILAFGPTVNLKAVITVTAALKLLALVMAALVTPVPTATRGGNSTPASIMLSTMKRVFQDRFSLAVVMYEATGRLDFYLPVVFQPLALLQGFSLVHFGLIFAGTQILQYLVQKQADKIIARWGVESILRLSPFLLAAGVLLLLVPGKLPILLGLAVTKVVGPIRYQCLSLQKNLVIDNQTRATFLSVISLGVLGVNSALLSLIGFALDRSTAFGIIGLTLMCLVGLVCYVPILKPTPSTERPRVAV